MTAPAPQSSMEIAREIALPSEIILSEARWNDLHTILAAALDAARARERERIESGVDAWIKQHDCEWCCCTCGPCKTSRGDWCDRGCGNDYNAMIRIDHRRVGRLVRLAIRALDTPAQETSHD